MINVAVGIIIDDQSPHSPSVLLCQRKPIARYGLKWEFPGGKVEPGETVMACLRRELREELSIEAAIGELFHQQQYVYPDSGSFDVWFYRVPSYTGQLRNMVFETIRWVPLHLLGDYDILEGNHDVILKLLQVHGAVGTKKN